MISTLNELFLIWGSPEWCGDLIYVMNFSWRYRSKCLLIPNRALRTDQSNESTQVQFGVPVSLLGLLQTDKWSQNSFISSSLRPQLPYHLLTPHAARQNMLSWAGGAGGAEANGWNLSRGSNDTPTPSGREWLARSWDSWVVTAAVMFVFYETELVFIKDNLK